MAALVSFKGTRPSTFRGRLSGGGRALSILPLLFRSPATKNCDSQVGAGKGPQPRQVLGQEAHPGPAAPSEHPDKGLLDNTALGELQGFFDVAFLGADNMCVVQWLRSKIKC